MAGGSLQLRKYPARPSEAMATVSDKKRSDQKRETWRQLILHRDGNSKKCDRNRDNKKECEANFAPHKPSVATLYRIDLKQTGVAPLHQSSATRGHAKREGN